MYIYSDSMLPCDSILLLPLPFLYLGELDNTQLIMHHAQIAWQLGGPWSNIHFPLKRNNRQRNIFKGENSCLCMMAEPCSIVLGDFLL